MAKASQSFDDYLASQGKNIIRAKCERCKNYFYCTEDNLKDGKGLCSFCWNKKD